MPEVKRGRIAGWAAFAFVGSGCLLVLEIVAERLLAPTLGVSLYTWTSVIGVVLAGVSLGKLPWRMDRRPLALPSSARAHLRHEFPRVSGDSRFRSLRRVATAAERLAGDRPGALVDDRSLLHSVDVHRRVDPDTHAALAPLGRQGGRVVGSIQAAAALGSIAGTFLAGFVLISAFGTRRIVAGVAVTLPVLVVAARPRGFAAGSSSSAPSWPRSSPSAGPPTAPARGRATTTAFGSSTTVLWAVGRGSTAACIWPISSTASSTLTIRPTLLRLRAAVRARDREAHPRGANVDTFFAGGGSYTFPRWLETSYPRAHRRGRDRSRGDEHRVHATRPESNFPDRDAECGRPARLREMPAAKRFDFVLGDAFDDVEVPYHLTTGQFNDLVAQHLKPEMLYLANVIDSVHFDFLRCELRRLRQTFPYVELMAQRGDWPPVSGQRGTYVLVAAKRAPPRALPVLPARQVDEFVAHSHSVVLTDDYAPVDQLFASVFAQKLHLRR